VESEGLIMAASKRVILAAFICVACAANASTDARAQVRMELTPTTEIPRSYKSWSLFLICNPAWIVENGDKGIEELFHRYKAFGESIGPNNLAIWFWRKPAVAPTQIILTSAAAQSIARSTSSFPARARMYW
jgi:hypothetical protein